MTRASRGAALCWGVLALFPAPARAFHGVGIPHYAYDEQDPGTPLLTYDVEAGPYLVTAVARPGILRPGDRCAIRVRIEDRRRGAAFAGPVRLALVNDGMLWAGSPVFGPIESAAGEDGYGFEPSFPWEGNYVARIEFEADAAEWRIDLPMVVGEPGSPWAVVGATAGGMTAVLLGVAVARARLRRNSGRRAVTGS